MRGTKKTVYEWFMIVEGVGEFPYDMLRYDSAFPFEERDSHKIQADRRERRRVVLVRRGVNQDTGNVARWKSFGWSVLTSTTDSYDARALAEVVL